MGKASLTLCELRDEERARLEAGAAGRGDIAQLEETFARWLGVPWAVSVSSGTLALYFALRAVGVRPGDEVIVPAFDWFAATAAVLHCGAIPRFADVELTTYTLSPHAVARCRTESTRAVIATHLFGNPCDLPVLRRWCDCHQIALIEDASQAAGAECAGKKVGSWGDLACFSLTFSKPLNAGEGGIIVTAHEELYARLLALCTHPLRQLYAGIEPNPFCLRAPLNPLGVERFLQAWQAFPQTLRQQQAALHQLNTFIESGSLPLLPVYTQHHCTHAGYRLCPRMWQEQAIEAIKDELETAGWLVWTGSPAHYLPRALHNALQTGVWDTHPHQHALQRAAQACCPNARRLQRTLITVETSG